MASTKLIIRDGQALSVYDDRWQPILKALGHQVIERASEVEHNGTEWEARLKSTGQVIATGPNRAAVIAAEVTYLEENRL